MDDPTLRAAIVGSIAALLGGVTPVVIMLFRSKAKSSEAHATEDSARAKKEELEAENQRFVLELARNNIKTAQTLINLQTELDGLKTRERELSEKLDKSNKRISWLEKKVVELGGTIDEDDSYPLRELVPNK